MLARFVRRDLSVAFLPWLLARVIVGSALATSRYLFDRVGSGEMPLPLDLGLFAWDGEHYRTLAEHGYGPVSDIVRFFPFFPLLGRALGSLTFGADIALVLIANLSALLFAALLHALMISEAQDPRLARKCVWIATLAPPLFVLVLAYSEAIYLLLSVGVFALIRRRRFALAAFPAVLAGACRPVGHRRRGGRTSRRAQRLPGVVRDRVRRRPAPGLLDERPRTSR